MLIKYVITIGGILAIAVLAFYVFGIEPTELALKEGTNFHDVNFTKVNQSGKTEPYSTVLINGESVSVDKNGNFYKVITLKNGTNIITVEAKAPFKSKTVLNTTIVKKNDKDGVSAEWTMDQMPEVQQY